MLSASRADLPPEIGGILTQCLNKKPDERFSSAVQLHSELKRVLRNVELGTATDQRLKAPAITTTVPAGAAGEIGDEGVGGTPWKWLDSRWGITALIVSFQQVNTPHRQVLDTLQLFAEEVMPGVRRAG